MIIIYEIPIVFIMLLIMLLCSGAIWFADNLTNIVFNICWCLLFVVGIVILIYTLKQIMTSKRWHLVVSAIIFMVFSVVSVFIYQTLLCMSERFLSKKIIGANSMNHSIFTQDSKTKLYAILLAVVVTLIFCIFHVWGCMVENVKLSVIHALTAVLVIGVSIYVTYDECKEYCLKNMNGVYEEVYVVRQDVNIVWQNVYTGIGNEIECATFFALERLEKGNVVYFTGKDEVIFGKKYLQVYDDKTIGYVLEQNLKKNKLLVVRENDCASHK